MGVVKTITGIFPSKWSGGSEYDEDDEEKVGSNWWWDFKQNMLEIPRLVTALFIKPDHDGIYDTRDLVYQYGQAVKHIPSLLRRLAFKTRTLEDELHEAMLRGSLRKKLNGFDLLMIGLGVVIGTGAFSLTGQGQAVYAGSALLVSYAVAGLACVCSAACYAELCMEYPVAGSAFTYIMIIFGEYPAFITLGMLILEYGLGMAAVANGFSKFFALLIDQSASLFIIDEDGVGWDVMALAVVLIVSVVLSFGGKESSLILAWTTMIKIGLILAISIVAFTKSYGPNFADNFGLSDKEVDGVFQGTAFIFFAYIAFDAVCNAVEEARNPRRIPNAIIGTVLISSIVYMIMSTSLSLMIDPATLRLCIDDQGDLLDTQPIDSSCDGKGQQPGYVLAYVFAFNEEGLPGMQYVVAVAALLGITTALLVGLYSVARLAMVAARTWLLPPQLARISPRTQTPIIAQMTVGFIIALISLITDFSLLSELSSLGALFAMWIVSNAILFRRYFPEVKLRYTAHGTVEAELSKTQWWMPGAVFSKKARRIIVWVHIILVNAMAFGFVINYRLLVSPECLGENSYQNPVCAVQNLETPNASILYPNEGVETNPWVVAWIIAWAVVTLSMFFMCPLEYRPKTWAIKPYLLPFMPSFAILLIAFSAGSMASTTWIYFIGYILIVTFLYIFFAMPLSYIRHFTIGPSNAEALQVVELVEVDGKYVPWESVQSPYSGITNYSTMDPSGRYSTYNISRTQTFSGGEDSSGGHSSTGSDGSPLFRKSYFYRIDTKVSGGLPRLQEDAENEGKEDEGEHNDRETEKKKKTAAVDSAYGRV